MVRLCACLSVRGCAHARVYVYVYVTEGSGAAVCSTGWQGGCQNGPISCVSSKIGPNTAEMHDTLWLFTARTQCVCRMLPSIWNQTHSALLYLLTDGKNMYSLWKTYTMTGKGSRIVIKWKAHPVIIILWNVFGITIENVCDMGVRPWPPPYVGAMIVLCMVRSRCPAYVTAPTSCSWERCPLCVCDNKQTYQMTQTYCHLASLL